MPHKDAPGDAWLDSEGCSARAQKKTGLGSGPKPQSTGWPPPGERYEPSDQQCRECLEALAHRLSQPLTALRGSMELALLGVRSAADYRAALEQSFQLAEYMVQLIRSLRDLAESTAPSGVSERVSLDKLVRAVVEELRGLAESRGLEMALTLSREVSVWGDPGRVREAVLRVVHGTIHRSPEGGTIRISLATSDGSALLTLFDPRPGAPVGETGAWSEVSNPGVLFSEAAKGSSLEWAITHRWVEALGGALQTESGAPHEFCSRLRLPLADEEAA